MDINGILISFAFFMQLHITHIFDINLFSSWTRTFANVLMINKYNIMATSVICINIFLIFLTHSMSAFNDTFTVLKWLTRYDTIFGALTFSFVLVSPHLVPHLTLYVLSWNIYRCKKWNRRSPQNLQYRHCTLMSLRTKKKIILFICKQNNAK